jgi:hypothetical protein
MSEFRAINSDFPVHFKLEPSLILTVKGYRSGANCTMEISHSLSPEFDRDRISSGAGEVASTTRHLGPDRLGVSFTSESGGKGKSAAKNGHRRLRDLVDRNLIVHRSSFAIDAIFRSVELKFQLGIIVQCCVERVGTIRADRFPS